MDWNGLEGGDRGLIEVPPRKYMERLKNTTKNSVIIPGVPANTQTKYLANTSLECYWYTSLFAHTTSIDSVEKE
jgi:hypothetical protein